MTRLEASVVVSEAFDVPVAPTPAGRTYLVNAGCLFGTCQQPVGMVEGMLGNPLAWKDGLFAVLQQRAATDTTALRAPAAARKHGASRRGSEDDSEMPAVCARHRIDVEGVGRKDMVGQNRIFSASPR